MKRYLVFIFSLIVSLSAVAQTFTWIDGEETGYEYNPAMVNYSVCSSSDGTVWFGGLKERVTSYYLMMGRNFLIRYDAQGTRLETDLIEGNLVITAMKCDPAGNLYLAGDFLDQDILFWDGTLLPWNGNSINSFVARINSQGVVDWAVNLNTALGEYAPVSDMAWSNGNMYLAHSIWQSPRVSSIDGSGNASPYITMANIGIISGIDFDANGNLYCTGSCAGTNSLYNGISFPAPSFYNKYLVRFNPAGVPVWVKYSEDGTCIHPKVRVDLNNDLYWTGHLLMPGMFDTLTLLGPSWSNDFYLVKMNSQGNAIWGREVPQVLTGDATVGALDILRVMPDNSVTLGGVTRGTVDWGNGVTSDMGSMNQGAWLINYGAEGTPNYTRIGQGDYIDLKSLDMDASGNIYFTGVGHDTIHAGNLDLFRESYYYPYLAKLDVTTTGSDEKRPEDHAILSPNPARDHVTILPDGPIIGNMEIADLTGKTVMQVEERTRIDISSLSPGVYIVRGGMQDGRECRVKLVKW